MQVFSTLSLLQNVDSYHSDRLVSSTAYSGISQSPLQQKTFLQTNRQPPLVASDLPVLTTVPPLQSCRICVVIPVRNEADNLQRVIQALAQQVNDEGCSIDFDSYEILLLANNCSDKTVSVARKLSRLYPALRLHTIAVSLPKSTACVGKARQMAMDEAYRRLSSIGIKGRIIASTDGDTEVSPNWISALITEFDQGVDAVGGRILTHRANAPEIDKCVSLYFLRILGHDYLTSQIECLLDPQPHDSWPRHGQYYGANMAVSAEMYGKIGGMPSVKDEEDVALYKQLKRADAKIRHSLSVRVLTSARRNGRATGGLAERLEELAQTSQEKKAIFVELPQITEARILVRKQLRQAWMIWHYPSKFNVRCHERTALLLSQNLGMSPACLRCEIEQSPTFGILIESVIAHQRRGINLQTLSEATMEISQANMALRERLRLIRQQQEATDLNVKLTNTPSFRFLQTLQQVQAIPLFSFTQ